MSLHSIELLLCDDAQAVTELIAHATSVLIE